MTETVELTERDYRLRQAALYNMLRKRPEERGREYLGLSWAVSEVLFSADSAETLGSNERAMQDLWALATGRVRPDLDFYPDAEAAFEDARQEFLAEGAPQFIDPDTL